jgi:hypothetical protein
MTELPKTDDGLRTSILLCMLARAGLLEFISHRRCRVTRIDLVMWRIIQFCAAGSNAPRATR